MRNTLKVQSGVVVVIVVAVAIIYPLFVFFPKMRAIAAVRSEIRQKQDYIAQSQKLQSLLAEQGKKLADTKKYVDEESGRLVAPDQLSHVFSAISRSAQDVGATTTRFEPRPPIKGDTYRKVPVLFGVMAPTETVQQLIASIESMPKNIWIEGLKIDVPSEDSEIVRCQIDLAIFVDNREISD
jgi:Tfp pilus assembly protein PilO